jgi:hypothetical protein
MPFESFGAIFSGSLRVFLFELLLVPLPSLGERYYEILCRYRDTSGARLADNFLFFPV